MKDLAKIKVFGAAFSTLIVLCIYFQFREDGIVPAIILAALINLFFAERYFRKVRVSLGDQSWSETLQNAKSLFSLGSAFMYGALLASLSVLAIRGLISAEYDIETIGLYHAAWSLSGMVSALVIGAMAADFFPRLTTVANDDVEVNRLVNQQIQIGVLLALPGLNCIIGFSTIAVVLLYSQAFVSAADLIPLLAVGVFIQVITFPIGFIQRAKAITKWIYISQTHINVLHVVLVLLTIGPFGISGAAWSFTVSTVVHGVLTLMIGWHLSKYKISSGTWKIVIPSLLLLLITSVSYFLFSNFVALLVAGVTTVSAFIFSLRKILFLVGPNHLIFRFLSGLPFLNQLCKMKQ